MVNWNSDEFNIWYQRNGLNLAVGIASGLFSAIIGYSEGEMLNEDTGERDILGTLPRSRKSI